MSTLVNARKQPRLANSCDFCRKRKIKCDSSTMPNNECSSCQLNGKPCTHEHPIKRRGIKNYAKEVSQLTLKVQQLEDALRTSRDRTSTSPHPGSTPVNNEDPELDEEYMEMVDDFKRFSIYQNIRYFGPSSNIYFMCKMMDSTPSMNGALSRSGGGKKWSMNPWETGADAIYRPHLQFPDSDLLQNLIDLYFVTSISLPVLHESSFRKDVSAGLHHTDYSFGFVVLLVCAIASRGSNDPRVLLDGVSKHSAGWKYFVQTASIPRPLFTCPTIHDVQYCVLHGEYTAGTSAPQSNWVILGIGIRYAIELGYHRRHQGKPTVESEIKKRVFWCLIVLDRHLGLYFGRPFSIRDEDFDLDFPIQCDDEYMSTGNPESDFKQPPDKPARISAFLHHLRMVNIISVVMKTIYGTKKSRQAAGCPSGPDDNTVSLIDSMLNAWFIAIPDHLRWEHAQSTLYSRESGFLYLMYYDIQIFVHRPFMHKNTRQAIPSMAICMNAARLLSRLLETYQQTHKNPFFALEMTAFSAGIILVSSIRKRRHLNPHQPAGGRDLEDLYRCIRVLSSAQEIFSISTRLIHSLQVLADLPTSSQPPTPYERKPSLAVVSGYATGQNHPPLDLSDLDPTLFGLLPHANNTWLGDTQADMSVFDMEGDVNKWLEASSSIPNWVQDPSGGLFNDSFLYATRHPMGPYLS